MERGYYISAKDLNSIVSCCNSIQDCINGIDEMLVKPAFKSCNGVESILTFLDSMNIAVEKIKETARGNN